MAKKRASAIPVKNETFHIPEGFICKQPSLAFWLQCRIDKHPLAVVRWHREGFRDSIGVGNPRPEMLGVQKSTSKSVTSLAECPKKILYGDLLAFKLNSDFSVSMWLNRRSPNIESRYANLHHFNVTDHSTSIWTAQQMIEAFPEEASPRFLLRDRDSIYGKEFRSRVKGMQIEELITAPHSPWQSPYRISAISTVRSVSIYPLDLGWTRSNSIPRIELGSLRIANWLPKGQDEVFDMDWYILNYVFQK